MSESRQTIKSLLSRKGNTADTDIISKAKKTVSDHKAKIESAESVGVKSSAETNRQLHEMSKELDKMFSPSNFRGIVRGPADFMLATSGRKLWDLPKEEVDTLASTASITARHFLSTDPKWLALTLFSMAALTTYGTRTAMHLQMVRDEKKVTPKTEVKP